MGFSDKKPRQTAQKVNKVTNRHERIFYHAVALQQSGRLRSLIYCQKSCIYILNQDNTVLLRFPLQKNHFKHPFSFKANDYDSNKFIEKNGQIIFRQQHGEYQRDKSCRLADNNDDVIRLYKKHKSEEKKNAVVLNQDFLKCIDANLNHIEFKIRKGTLISRQRNLYDGTVITIIKKDSKKEEFFTKPLQDFSTTGVRTADFLALFSFANTITFYFSGKNVISFESKDVKMPFTGIISRCVYDEMGVEENGR